MTATYTLTTAIGRVRLLIPDRDIDPASDATFSDEELTEFLTYNSGSERLAAALALEIAAMDELLTFKVMKSGSDSVDASKLAEILLKRADRLRGQEPLTAFTGYIGIIEQGHGVFGQRERVWNEIIRSG